MSAAKNESLQAQVEELDELLAWFDQPNIDLDEALTKFDHGVKLTEKLKARLNALDNKITILKQRFDQENL